MRSTLAGALLALFACGPSERTVAAGSEIDRVAFIRRSESGEWRGASALMPIDDAVRVAVAPGETVLVALWSEEDLTAALGALPAEDLLASQPLVPRGSCQRALPPPTEAQRIDGDDVSAIDGGEIPLLTAPWAELACPELAMAAQVVCGEIETECPIRHIQQDGCRYTLGFECELGAVRIRRGGGEVCVETEGCAVTPERDGRFVLTCDATCVPGDSSCATSGQRPVACRGELTADGRFPASDDVRRIALAEGPTTTPPPGMYNFLHRTTVDTGYLGVPVLVGQGPNERLIVPVHDYRIEETCAAGSATRLAVIRTDTASVVAVVPSEVCLEALAPDPIGPGFLGLFGDERRLLVGRFDASGRRTQAVEILGAGSLLQRPLLAAQPGLIAAVYTRSSTRSDRNPTHIVTLDPITLEIVAQRTDVTLDVVTLTLTPDPYVVTADDLFDRVTWWAPDLEQCVGSAIGHLLSAPIQRDLTNLPIHDVLYVESPRQLAILLNEQPAIHQVTDLCSDRPGRTSQECWTDLGTCTNGVRAFPGERGFEPLRARWWPVLDRQLVVAGTYRPAYREWRGFRAAVMRYDPTANLFPPGLLDLGPGIARDVRVDGQDRVWVTLPWSGEVVRLSPR